MREGQTQRQAANGKYARNAANKQARTNWMNDNKRDNSNFPRDTCNGKKNRLVRHR